MPSFSKSLESSLHRALEYANERSHEFATLEHLLAALIDDRDAAAVMRACNVDLDQLCARVVEYLDPSLATSSQGFRRGAADHRLPARHPSCRRACVQSSGREEVTGANVLVAIFAERESHAAFFLQEQEMTRFDAVQYISHGIAKRAGMTEPNGVRGIDDEQSNEAERTRSPARTRSIPIASTSIRRRARAASIR